MVQKLVTKNRQTLSLLLRFFLWCGFPKQPSPFRLRLFTSVIPCVNNLFWLVVYPANIYCVHMSLVVPCNFESLGRIRIWTLVVLNKLLYTLLCWELL